MQRCVALLMALLTIASASYAAETVEEFSQEIASSNNPFRARHLLVKRRAGVKAQALVNTHLAAQTEVVKRFKHPRGLELVRVPSEKSLKDVAKAYLEDPNVLYVEPDYVLYATSTPNDAQFGDQWALNNIGQSGGTADVDINAPEAWDISPGEQQIVLAVIDTGVLYTHPDLKDNIWNNPGEIAGNRKDDDNNGYVDDVHGINAITKSGDPKDDNGHGTHVAGIMAATGNNGVGVVGVNQKASVLGCKFLDAGGSGSTSDAITCLNYLADLATRTSNPVHVVASNNSWAGGGYSEALLEAIEANKAQGILFMAAASNEGQDNDQVGTYPANYPSANIISVAATDRRDGLASFSNYGRYSVHVAAPGVDILSTYLSNGYDELSGTSMATPHVTGLAGLIKAHNPNLSWTQIKNLILAGGKEIPAAAKTISGRRIRVADADGAGSLTCRDQVVSSRLSPRTNALTVPVGSSVTLSAIHINCAEPAGAPEAQLADGSFLTLEDNGQGKDSAAGDGVYTKEWAPESSGTYELNLLEGTDPLFVTVYNPAGWHSYRKGPSVSFNYRTISGTALGAGDDTIHVVTSPFGIKFAGDGSGFRLLHVGSNGTISFTDSGVLNWQNTTLPNSQNTTIVAPFWDDLVSSPSTGGDVYYDVLGTAPNREFVIEWRNMKHYDANENLTFQVVFFENSSDILFNYKDTDVGNSRFNQGASATIGIQVASDKAVQFSYNKASVNNNTAVLFVQNNRPAAEAGEDMSVSSGDEIQLDGSLSTDPDGNETLTYSWAQVGGDDVPLKGDDSLAPTVSAKTSTGTLTFELTVMDDGGETSTDRVKVYVTGNYSSHSGGGGGGSSGGGSSIDPNISPVSPVPLEPKAYQTINVLAPVLKVDNATDLDGDTLTYDFEIDDNLDFESPEQVIASIPEGTNGSTEITADPLKQEGDYYWRARAYDGESYGKWVTSSFSIKLPSTPPISPDKPADAKAQNEEEQAVQAASANKIAFGCNANSASGGGGSFVGLLTLIVFGLRLAKRRI